MTLSGDVGDRARAGLFAVAKWSRIPALGRFVAGRFGEAWVDPSEAEAYDLAARSAYHGNLSVDAESGPLPIATDDDDSWFPAPAEPSAVAPFVLTPWPPTRDNGALTPASAWAPPSAEASVGRSETVPTTDVEPGPAGRAGPQRRTPGDTAPEFLLRTPANVAPVADGFFDGLVGLVEGDR